MSAPSLDLTQRLLWKLITAPEGAAAGRAGLTASERVTAERLVRADERLSAIERIDIYANMYFYRIRDCLKEDFAALCAVVGADNFHNLITDYLLAHPPVHFSLRYAGRHLPDFVALHHLSQQWPYLADLARLEWSILDAFDAADAPPLDAAALAAVAAERWPELRFQLTPSLRVLRLGWPVQEIWHHAQRGESPSALRPEDTALRVWRQDLRVFHRPMDAAETAGLLAVAAAAPFAAVCEQITLYDDAGADAAAQRAFSLISQWLTDGLLTGYALD